MNRAELLHAIGKSRFASDIGLFEPLIRPSLRIMPTLAGPRGLETGASRMGGPADLPSDFEWPHFEGQPLHFLCQIDLGEVARLGPFDGLPETGWLAFFHGHGHEQPWGFAEDRGTWRVAYFDGRPGDLVRRASPPILKDQPSGGYRPCTLQMAPEACLPDVFDLLFPLDAYDEAVFETYTALLEQTGTTIEPFHRNNRLLGYPALMQADMQVDCEVCASGFDLAEWDIATPDQVKVSLPGAFDWQLLLQIDTDEQGPGWDWGLGGRLYFWIRRQDLQSRNFDGVWLKLQT